MARKITIKVQTNSKRNLIKPDGDGLIVYTTVKPVGGEANAKVVSLLSDYLNVAKTSIKIVQGDRNKTKTIEISE